MSDTKFYSEEQVNELLSMHPYPPSTLQIKRVDAIIGSPALTLPDTRMSAKHLLEQEIENYNKATPEHSRLIISNDSEYDVILKAMNLYLSQFLANPSEAVYRRVDVNERLPKFSGTYTFLRVISGMQTEASHFIFKNDDEDVKLVFTHWLEEVHLPKQEMKSDDIQAFLKWLTDKDSQFSIMYGGTPELEKDYRFATNDEDYTIEEVYKFYQEFQSQQSSSNT